MLIRIDPTEPVLILHPPSPTGFNLIEIKTGSTEDDVASCHNIRYVNEHKKDRSSLKLERIDPNYDIGYLQPIFYFP